MVEITFSGKKVNRHGEIVACLREKVIRRGKIISRYGKIIFFLHVPNKVRNVLCLQTVVD